MDVCRKYKELQSLAPSYNTRTLQDFSYISQYNMLLCRINKCGTSSWVHGTFEQLAPALGIKNYKQQRPADKKKHFEVASVEALSDILTRNPLSIVHVRHPFDRLVSGPDCYVLYQQRLSLFTLLWYSMTDFYFPIFFTHWIILDCCSLTPLTNLDNP